MAARPAHHQCCRPYQRQQNAGGFYVGVPGERDTLRYNLRSGASASRALTSAKPVLSSLGEAAVSHRCQYPPGHNEDQEGKASDERGPGG